MKKVNLDKEIINYSYVIAIQSATMRATYKGDSRSLRNDSEYAEVIRIIKRLVDRVITKDFDSQKAYDKAFLKAVIEVRSKIRRISGEDEFTFGNAQKLINIMMKNLYIYSYGDLDKKDAFRFCHCPMDGILLKKIWNNRESLSQDIRERMCPGAQFTRSWGNEDLEDDDYPQRYLVFQDAVKEMCEKIQSDTGRTIYPLEYDYCIWK